MRLEPDVIARLHRYPREQGRSTVIPAVQFGCSFFFENVAFDCRLLLEQTGQVLEPGATVEVPIEFLNSSDIKHRLRPGASFNLWDARTFAEDVVVEVLRDRAISAT